MNSLICSEPKGPLNMQREALRDMLTAGAALICVTVSVLRFLSAISDPSNPFGTIICIIFGLGIALTHSHRLRLCMFQMISRSIVDLLYETSLKDLLTEPSQLLRALIVVGVANTVGKEEAVELFDSFSTPDSSLNDKGLVFLLPKMVQMIFPTRDEILNLSSSHLKSSLSLKSLTPRKMTPLPADIAHVNKNAQEKFRDALFSIGKKQLARHAYQELTDIASKTFSFLSPEKISDEVLIATATVLSACFSAAHYFGVARRGKPRSGIEMLLSGAMQAGQAVCTCSALVIASRFTYRSSGHIVKLFQRSCSKTIPPVFALLALAAYILVGKMRRDIRNMQWIFRIWAERLMAKQTVKYQQR